MNIAPQTQAVLLLTAYLSKPMGSSPRPLSPIEWGRFALWLKERGVAPETLLGEDPAHVLAGWKDKSVTVDRIRDLIGRAGALGFALEKWQRAGLWVMTRSDTDYPIRFKRRLKTESPPILFGCGNRKLLGGQCVAVVGSRDATENDLAFATRLGVIAAAQGLSVVSGGARGIDEAAMLGALDREGTVIGVLADGLLRAAISTKYRKGLMANDLVLISPFNPDAGFDVGNAMGRNKYIYCLSDAAIVVSSGKEKGGTWNGAIENIKQRWVPVWVKTNSQSSGNAGLVERGARWLPEDDFDLRLLSGSPNGMQPTQRTSGLFDGSRQASDLRVDLTGSSSEPHVSEEVEVNTRRAKATERNVEEPGVSSGDSSETLSFYSLFLNSLKILAAKSPATPGYLLTQMDINRTQLQDWLKRALQEGRVKKLKSPVRYQWQAREPEQRSMFHSN